MGAMYRSEVNFVLQPDCNKPDAHPAAGTAEICENDGNCKIAFIHFRPARTPPSLMQMRFPHDFPILIKRH
jgi:hypothetical protein